MYRKVIESRDVWLAERFNGIGGSEAGAVLGLNKYKTNVQLWEEKTGLRQISDISDKPAVAYGKNAELHLRELFKLDFPQYTVNYHEFYMYFNSDYPFIFATLDGEILAENGQKGVLEIKTTTIRNSSQWAEWDGRIPDSYYAQILHQLTATGWDFAILKAHIRYQKNGDLQAITRHYRIDREDVLQDIEQLIKAECDFWEHVRKKSRPALILPEI